MLISLGRTKRPEMATILLAAAVLAGACSEESEAGVAAQLGPPPQSAEAPDTPGLGPPADVVEEEAIPPVIGALQLPTGTTADIRGLVFELTHERAERAVIETFEVLRTSDAQTVELYEQLNFGRRHSGLRVMVQDPDGDMLEIVATAYIEEIEVEPSGGSVPMERVSFTWVDRGVRSWIVEGDSASGDRFHAEFTLDPEGGGTTTSDVIIDPISFAVVESRDDLESFGDAFAAQSFSQASHHERAAAIQQLPIEIVRGRVDEATVPLLAAVQFNYRMGGIDLLATEPHRSGLTGLLQYHVGRAYLRRIRIETDVRGHLTHTVEVAEGYRELDITHLPTGETVSWSVD